MKAVHIHQYGGKEVLQYEDCPVPSISDKQMLIKVVATARSVRNQC